MKNPIILFALLVSALSAQAGTPNVPASRPVPPHPVARVNGAVLTDHDLKREMLAIFPYAAQHGGEFPKAMEPNIRKGAMQMIIFDELLYQEALRLKMTVPPAKMERAWAEFRKEFTTPAEYQRFLQTETNGSAEQARTQIRRTLLIEEFMKAEIDAKAVVPVAEARAYYDKNPTAFLIPESYAVQTISMVPPANATPAQMEEANRNAIKALKQAQATKSYEQFGLLAEKISEDDYRVMMGDHRAMEAGKLPPPILKAVQHMQPGEISGIIQVDRMFAIVRLNKHTPAGTRKFEEVQDALRKQMEKTRTEQLRNALDRRLRAKAKIEEL
jgi:peptidyl-prolyl cis-trans isomerase SurA